MISNIENKIVLNFCKKNKLKLTIFFEKDWKKLIKYQKIAF